MEPAATLDSALVIAVMLGESVGTDVSETKELGSIEASLCTSERVEGRDIALLVGLNVDDKPAVREARLERSVLMAVIVPELVSKGDTLVSLRGS